MNPYQPSEPPEPFVCEKCKARDKPESFWQEMLNAVYFIAFLFAVVWLFGTAMHLSGVRWIFVNERTGEVNEWEVFPFN